VAVGQIGEEPFKVLRGRVSEVVTVSTDEICAAIKDIFDDTRSIAEPAGALAVAGLKKYVAEQACRDRTLVAIDSGANMNFDRLRHVAERAQVGEQAEALFAVTIPERPGAFLQFCDALGKLPVTEFNYRYGDDNEAVLFVGIGLGEETPRETVRDRIEGAGFPVVDMTDNEVAKLHVRFMVGGRASAASERIVRFEFPERPGALAQFLLAMGGRWNISLFHYRNHGAAFGRVLCGMQVPGDQQVDFIAFLDSLGYAYTDETENPAYSLFLR
jgi:threonine dehydratase